MPQMAPLMWMNLFFIFLLFFFLFLILNFFNFQYKKFINKAPTPPLSLNKNLLWKW